MNVADFGLPPVGFREDPDSGTLRCPHRDLSTCPTCAAEYVEMVEVFGAHYWIADADARGVLLAEVAR